MKSKQNKMWFMPTNPYVKYSIRTTKDLRRAVRKRQLDAKPNGQEPLYAVCLMSNKVVSCFIDRVWHTHVRDSFILPKLPLRVRFTKRRVLLLDLQCADRTFHKERATDWGIVNGRTTREAPKHRLPFLLFRKKAHAEAYVNWYGTVTTGMLGIASWAGSESVSSPIPGILREMNEELGKPSGLLGKDFIISARSLDDPKRPNYK